MIGRGRNVINDYQWTGKCRAVISIADYFLFVSTVLVIIDNKYMRCYRKVRMQYHSQQVRLRH